MLAGVRCADAPPGGPGGWLAGREWGPWQPEPGRYGPVRVGRALLSCALAAFLGHALGTAAWPVPAPREVRALAVFARFAAEGRGAGEAIPAFGSLLFDPTRPGSLTHYYHEMSRGQFEVWGEVFPRWITVAGDEAQYLPPRGEYGDFVREVLAILDDRLDLGAYDNDGADGLPNSGDDDGYVDFLFVLTQTAPEGFIRGAATGISGLGLAQDYETADAAASAGRIRVRADSHVTGAGGTLQRGDTFAVAVGHMAHELGHLLGLVDLYDLSHSGGSDIDPVEDSAGIGYWGLMGHGALGWDDQGGPNPLCAWSLKRLGWLGVNNSQLRLVESRIDSAVLRDVSAGGTVYQLPIRGDQEYLLVEARLRGTSYYERNLPGEGVLIWHVVEDRDRGNVDETAKLVDLVCADGLYRDGGYGTGSSPAPFGDGGDNLDFWAHDEAYRRQHGGNLGDATDMFDGEVFRDFWALSNPAAPAGVSVTGIGRAGDHFVACLDPADRRRAGPVTGVQRWAGAVEVVGDVTVPAGARLSLAPGVEVVFGTDGLQADLDPERSELIVEGELVTETGGGPAARLTSAAALPAAGDWYGIRWLASGPVALRDLSIEHAVVGLSAVGAGQGMDLRRVAVRGAAEAGIVLRDGQVPSTLAQVEVSDTRGPGMVLAGRAPVDLVTGALRGNAGGGVVRSGGPLECRDSQFAADGAAADTAALLTFGPESAGSVSGSTFTGGVGVRCLASKEVTIAANRFVANRIGVATASAQPRISGNAFAACELVLLVEGFGVPARVDLNAVEQAVALVRNRTGLTLSVTNNWWGSADPAWIEARMDGPILWQPFLDYDPRQPLRFALWPASPNPFREAAEIRYDVSANELVLTGRARTVLEIRALTGGLVRRLVDQAARPGSFAAVWDGRGADGRRAASGLYYCQLEVGPLLARRPLTLLR